MGEVERVRVALRNERRQVAALESELEQMEARQRRIQDKSVL